MVKGIARQAPQEQTVSVVQVDKVIVLWTANTERYSEVAEGLNDTTEAFLSSIESDESEIAPSSIYAAAAILEGAPFINGSPQNTFVPGLIDLAVEKGGHKGCLHNCIWAPLLLHPLTSGTLLQAC